MTQEHRFNHRFTYANSEIFQGFPHLTLSHSTHSLALDIPPLIAEHGVEEPLWEVVLTGLDGEEDTRTFFAPAGEEEALLVALPQPFTHLEVTLGDNSFAFVGVSEDFPFLLVDEADRLANPAEGLYPATYYLLAPAGTNAGAGEVFNHGDWPGWCVQRLELRGQSPSVQLPQAEPVPIYVSEAPEFTWDTQRKTLPNSRGLDHDPIYTESPEVTVSGEGEWALDLEYVPMGGEREFVASEPLEPGTRAIFPADAFEDPWVGRYEVTLLRDGEVMDRRFFSIAEALHMRAKNEGPRGMNFRFIDAMGELSPFSYTLASPPAKPLVFEKGTRTFEATETSRVETVASEAGYELDFTVLPKTLRTSVKRTGAEPVEYFDKQVFLADQLDAEAMFTVYAPQPLPLAKFVVIDKRAKIRDVATTVRTTQARTVFSVSNRTLQEALRKQPAIELYLLWSTLSYEEYLEELPERDRKAHLKRPLARRVMEYEATASSDLIYAALATMRRTPLVSRATLTEEAIEIEQSLEEPVGLIGWAWALGNITAEPTPLTPSEEGFELPEELRGTGPLVLDIREDERLSDISAPEYPAASAVVADASGTVPPPETPAAAWETYRALRLIAQRTQHTGIHELYDAAVELLRSNPRAAVTSIPGTPAERAHALQATGLALYSFAGEGPGGPLTQVVDGQALAETRTTGVDSVTQPLLIMTAGGPAPTPESTELNDAGARIAALRECFGHDGQLARLGSIEQLLAEAKKLGGALNQLGVDKSVLQTVMAFDAFASGDTPHKAAAWVPYISYVFAIVSRALANGVVSSASALAIMEQDLPLLADVARLAPQLFRADFHTAEALTLYLAENR